MLAGAAKQSAHVFPTLPTPSAVALLSACAAGLLFFDHVVSTPSHPEREVALLLLLPWER
jgi:hypothetical protein